MIKQLDEKIKDAEENLGNSEIRDAFFNKAEYMENQGHSEESIEVYK